MKTLILNCLIGNNCPEFRNGLLDSHFFKLTLWEVIASNFFRDSLFQKDPDSVTIQNTSRFQTRALNTIQRICRL